MDVNGRIDGIEAGIPRGTDFEGRLALLEKAEKEERSFVADHSQGVATFSADLAKSIGLGKVEVSEIEFAARWHDIGKLAIPDEILRKPGRLSESEISVMKRHAQAGHALLGAEAPRLMKDVAAYHHERYDGFGYEGLKGEEIPLAARIVNIADVHDALIQERDYKSGMPEEDALMIMTNDAASPGFGRRAFDPFLLRRFVAMRLKDPSLAVSPENRVALDEYAASSPMEDIPGGWRENGGWHVKATGHRIKYETAENGNRRLAEMRGPVGDLQFTSCGHSNVAEATAEREDAPRM